MSEAEERVETPPGEREPAPKAEPAPEWPLDAAGRERPHFLLKFPDHPELNQLVRAFEAGQYALVHEHGRELAEHAEDPAVRRAARELCRRIEPDPLVKRLLFGAIALFLFLVWYTYAH
jgi:hypothetical protein